MRALRWRPEVTRVETPSPTLDTNSTGAATDDDAEKRNSAMNESRSPSPVVTIAEQRNGDDDKIAISSVPADVADPQPGDYSPQLGDQVSPQKINFSSRSKRAIIESDDDDDVAAPVEVGAKTALAASQRDGPSTGLTDSESESDEEEVTALAKSKVNCPKKDLRTDRRTERTDGHALF